MQMNKDMTNLELVKLLRSISAAYQVKDASPNSRFRVIAYNNASDALEHATSEAHNLWEEGKLDSLPGVGSGIQSSLDELFRTGEVKHFEEIMEGLPEAMFELMDIPGIGAKRAMKLTRSLGITKAHGAIEKLEKAANKGRIKLLEGFGEQSEREIIESIEEVKGRKAKRLLLPYATMVAEEVLEWIKQSPHIIKVDNLGSLRRRVSTIGDIDFAIVTDHPKEVIEHFTNYPKKVRLIEAGPFSSSILLAGAVHVDIMVGPKDNYGALLQHFTGSKFHNVALRTYAQKKGLSLSEHGIKNIEKDPDKIIAYKTEEEFYRALGMDWIPPEIRENQGEIELALKGELPKLVELKDIKGDLHMHINWPEQTSHDAGQDSLEKMVLGAQSIGYEYIGITEHNPKSADSESIVLEIMKRKREIVDEMNFKLESHDSKFQVFNGIEIDIQPTGKLSLYDSAFEYLDYAVVSIHNSFKGTKIDQTNRVLKALEHPKVKIWGHPTGRKLNERGGVDVDWEKVFEFCVENNKWIEINSSPDRLDLPDTLVYEAIKKGVKLTIDTDSHASDWLVVGMRYGIDVARRGWAQKQDIMNTLSLEEFKKIILK